MNAPRPLTPFNPADCTHRQTFRQRIKQLARPSCSAIARLLLRVRSQPYIFAGDPVTLVIAPHQDDETLGCGGLIARKRLEGYEVHVIYVTDGGASHPDHPTLTTANLIALRETEARSAMAILGVETPALHFLGANDGTLAWLTATETENLTTRLHALISYINPSEIFAPCRDDGSSEHEAAFKLLQNALQRTRLTPRLYEYPLWSWWNPRLLLKPYLNCHRIVRFQFKNYDFLKHRAIACYSSQLEPTAPWKTPLLSPDFTRLFAKPEEFYFEI